MRGSSAAENSVAVPPPEIHAADAVRVQLRVGCDVVDRAHDVPHAPSDDRLADEQRSARGGLARFVRQTLSGVERITAASEPHRLDRHGRHAGLGHLDGEVVFVAWLVRPVASLFVDADDVVHAAAVAGDADHGCGRGLRPRRQQDVRQDADAGTAVEHNLLAPVGGERARLERGRSKRLAR